MPVAPPQTPSRPPKHPVLPRCCRTVSRELLGGGGRWSHVMRRRRRRMLSRNSASRAIGRAPPRTSTGKSECYELNHSTLYYRLERLDISVLCDIIANNQHPINDTPDIIQSFLYFENLGSLASLSSTKNTIVNMRDISIPVMKPAVAVDSYVRTGIF